MEFRSKQTAMTDSGPKFKVVKFLKIISVSFGVFLLLLFTAAFLRTLSLDVNAGLQLARWETRNNISLAIDPRQREELLANFKGKRRLRIMAADGSKYDEEAAIDGRQVDGSVCLTCRGRADPHRVVLRAGHQHHRAGGVPRLPPQRLDHRRFVVTRHTSRDAISLNSCSLQNKALCDTSPLPLPIQSSPQSSPPAWSVMNWWPTTATCSGCKDHSQT